MKIRLIVKVCGFIRGIGYCDVAHVIQDSVGLSRTSLRSKVIILSISMRQNNVVFVRRDLHNKVKDREYNVFLDNQSIRSLLCLANKCGI